MVTSEGKLLVAKIIAFMENEICSRPSMKKICLHFSISQSHLSHLFKKVCGISPMKFMLRLRMERAKLLLRSTSLRIHEIAYILDFADSSYFSRIFKRVTGMTPSKYRYQFKVYVEEEKNVRPKESKNRYRADSVD